MGHDVAERDRLRVRGRDLEVEVIVYVAVQVKSFEIDPGRKRVSSGETGFLASTSAYPYPFAKITFPSFTTATTAPAMSPRWSCNGIRPSIKASTSAVVSSATGFAVAVCCDCA